MQNIIEQVDYFACGSCSNQLSWLFKKTPKEKLTFPAGVFLIKHREKGYVLYDTGYSIELKKRKIKYWLYRQVTPLKITRDQMIDQQLKKRGIEPSSIRWIILSHLHPDHIGGANYFPNAQYIVTEAVLENYYHAKMKDLIFKEFLPIDFENRVKVLKTNKYMKEFSFKSVGDIFADGSLLLASFDGHASGQGCLFIPEKNLFIAADISWRIEFLSKIKDMKLIPSLIQNDISSYKKSSAMLQQIKNSNIKVVVSHDPVERIMEVIF